MTAGEDVFVTGCILAVEVGVDVVLCTAEGFMLDELAVGLAVGLCAVAIAKIKTVRQTPTIIALTVEVALSSLR